MKINSEIEIAQEAFDNSDIPITLQVHCQQELDVTEDEHLSSDRILTNFVKARGEQ